MKRDLDLIRSILLDIQDHHVSDDWYSVNVDERDTFKVNYHIKLLWDEGYIEAIDGTSNEGMEFHITGLTWKGHDFLEAARNSNTWEKAKNIIVSKSGPFTLEIMKELLLSIGKKSLGLEGNE